MDIKEKLDLWIKLTGVNPEEEKRSWTINLDGKLSEWDIKKMNKKLTEVSKYDIDGIYTNIYLKEYFNEFLKGKSFSFYEYLDKKIECVDFLNTCEKLKNALSNNNDIEMKLLDETRKAIQHYNIKDYELDIFDIVNLKISALINSDSLKVSQFKKGFKNNEGPKFIKDIYMVNNLDKLIKTIEDKSYNCISLNYIYDKDNVASSYFVFIIKSGENVFIMDDKPSYSHPNQKYMLRTQGRDMYERMDQTYFPYSLIDLNISKYFVSDNKSKMLDENEYINLGSISDMEISEALWTANMFSLINDKFFKNNYQCDEISYVGGMISHKLLSSNDNALVIYDSYEKLELSIIEEPNEIELEYDCESLGLFEDVIERLKDKVDINLINAVGDTDNYLIDSDSTKSISKKTLSLNINNYGTKKEIEYRQKWIARYNFAKQIDALAKEEFDEKRKEIENWYVNKVKNNINDIIDKVVYNKLHGDVIVENTICGLSSYPTKTIVEKFDIKKYRFIGGQLIRGVGYKNENLCCFSGKKANVVISIFPNNTDDLMILTGCKYDEIPDVLKNWSAWPKRHKGNCILDNIDPCDWVIRDYWYEFAGRINIFLSKTEYNNQYKKRGLEPDKFWLKNS